MNIDLLVTDKGDAGLLCSQNLMQKAIGIILDTDSGHLSIEFTDFDPLDLNIPVEEEYFNILDQSPFIYIGAVHEGRIGQAYQTPLMILNDPYRTQAFHHATEHDRPLMAFQHFIRSCKIGQPVHRDDISNENTLGSILGEVKLSSLEFAPQLSRRLGMEMAPQAPAPSAPGLGLGGSGGGSSRGTRPRPRATRPPPSRMDD